MTRRGLFITIEGGEGAGKSTTVMKLLDFLQNHNVRILTTREPGGTRIGEQIREVLLQERSEKMSAMAELLLIFAARAQHIQEIIRPALTDGIWVICDRFTDATYAYQCGGRGIAWETVKALEVLVQQELKPDFTLLLDIDAEIGMHRVEKRGGLDRFEQESIEFFKRIRASYLEQAQNSGGRYRIVDASQSLEQVEMNVLDFGRDLLECWNRRLSE